MLFALTPVFVEVIRDYPMFDEVKTKRRIGMSFMQLENRMWTLEWEGCTGYKETVKSSIATVKLLNTLVLLIKGMVQFLYSI